MKVYFSILQERVVQEPAWASHIKLAMELGKAGAILIETPYSRLDCRRQMICESFRDAGDDPNDALVMLDNDHAFPRNVVHELVKFPTELGVVASLAYKRGEPFNPIFFMKDESGVLKCPGEFDRKGVAAVDATAPCAMMIRRWVLKKLQAEGCTVLWQFTYDPPGRWWGEDMYFAQLCEQHGIQQYVNLEVESPHITFKLIGHDDWKPEVLNEQSETEESAA